MTFKPTISGKSINSVRLLNKNWIRSLLIPGKQHVCCSSDYDDSTCFLDQEAAYAMVLPQFRVILLVLNVACIYCYLKYFEHLLTYCLVLWYVLLELTGAETTELTCRLCFGVTVSCWMDKYSRAQFVNVFRFNKPLRCWRYLARMTLQHSSSPPWVVKLLAIASKLGDA